MSNTNNLDVAVDGGLSSSPVLLSLPLLRIVGAKAVRQEVTIQLRLTRIHHLPANIRHRHQ